MLFKKKIAKSVAHKDDILSKPLPKHIGIILDGNGRWAKQRGLPRTFGHQEGMINVKHIAVECSKIGVEAVTVYAFSTENWKRAADEVEFIMKLPIRFFDKFTPDLMANHIRLQVIGNKAELPKKLQEKIIEIETLTQNNNRMVLNVALNYGAHEEIIQMVKAISHKVKTGQIDENLLDAELVEAHLATKGIPPVDLLVRTSGELRISNFLLWQIAYAELHFTDVFWPDFKEEALYTALADFQSRKRRFGGYDKKVESQ